MLEVLQTFAENLAARETMNRRGLSCWPRKLPWRFADALRLRGPTAIGELNKSWDVLKTIELLESRCTPDSAILDFGAYASEVLCSLHRLGFRQLTGIDLNPAVKAMPFASAIRWETGDMMATQFADGSMSAITAISAIEHGVDLPALFREVGRLLTANGLFIASTDYWPDKIETHGIRMYDREWTIFSRREMDRLFEIAAEYGLEPLGAIHADAREAAIACAGRHYTFAWVALTKRTRRGEGADR